MIKINNVRTQNAIKNKNQKLYFKNQIVYFLGMAYLHSCNNVNAIC